jgi:hypothetical protein
VIGFFIMQSGSVVAAEMAVHDITAYTSTATGVREFNVLATGIRMDDKGLSTGKEQNVC